MGGKNPSSAEASGKAAESQSDNPVPKDDPVLPCETKDWFAFRVVDEAGAVVKDVTAEIVLTGGAKTVVDLSTVKLEKDGTWRSKKTLAAGDCTVSFPDLYNMEWWPQGSTAGNYTVAKKLTVGDDTCILALTDPLGFRDFLSVWSRSKNQTLRTKRPNANQLVKDDELLAPEEKDKAVKKATNQVWTFVVATKKPATLRVVLVDKDNKPLSGKSWELLTPVKKSGKTGADGLIEFKELPVSETAATLKVKMKDPPKAAKPEKPPKLPSPMPYPLDIVPVDFKHEPPPPSADDVYMEWTVKIGAVESFNTANGVRARLHNLGFGTDIGDEDDRLARAVKAYQKYFLKQDAGSGVAADIESDLRDRHDKP